MTSIKLYLLLIKDDDPVKISVHRDLNTLESEWMECNKLDTVGIIHISFLRPRPSKSEELLRFKGHILLTTTAKWALPEIYISSKDKVSQLQLINQTIPLYLLLRGLNYELDESSSHFGGYTELIPNNLTMLEAVQEILANCNRPLNKEEIYARIIERGLFEFDTKKPVSVLGANISKHTAGPNYSKPDPPLFMKFSDDRYTLINNVSCELEGWLSSLYEESPDLIEAANLYGIYNEISYNTNRQYLSNDHQYQFDIFRFHYYLPQINRNTDPQSIIQILPKFFLNSDVGAIDMPVRVRNVLFSEGIKKISDLSNISTTKMLMWPNFGKKSLRDLCRSLINAVSYFSSSIDYFKPGTSCLPYQVFNLPQEEQSEDDNVDYQLKLVSSISLKVHFQDALDSLNENDRIILEYRTGFNGEIWSLQDVGDLVGLTRERVRQIQSRCVSRIMGLEHWHDCIVYKIEQILINRTTPLYLEILEVEDHWFNGFMGNYPHLASIIELFSKNKIFVIKINSANVITRITAREWDEVVSTLRKNLHDKADEEVWTRQDIEILFWTKLSQKAAEELLPLLWAKFERNLQFASEDSNAKLVGFGKSAETAISIVLSKAEKPLHYSEIAKRATEVYGKPVNERLVHNALPKLGANLYGRGVYGLSHHNPIPDSICESLRSIVSEIIQDGPLDKQWHCKEIISQIKEQFPAIAIPKELDHYILNIILGNVGNIISLNRMIWARSDSGQSVDDRVDIANAFTKILEDNGGPLKGKELKVRLNKIRGLIENHQIQPNDRMIQIGPDYWGLVDRDIGGSKSTIEEKLNSLHEILNKRQKGIHISEVETHIEVSDNSSEIPSAYALLNLAQRDNRFYLGRSMYVGLS
ncbi:MAG: hypothetical protein OXD32_08270, partial [Endozoicomonadaceae bacterium]|nr:hypothetical protein [Endozoicomonadaceae bacterium]